MKKKLHCTTNKTLNVSWGTRWLFLFPDVHQATEQKQQEEKKKKSGVIAT